MMATGVASPNAQGQEMTRNASALWINCAHVPQPNIGGNTATNTLKPATVETGATVRVPLFVNEGETIEVDTRDGSYQSRVR